MQESMNHSNNLTLTQQTLTPAFSTLEEVQNYLKSNQKLWELFHLLSPKIQQELLDFCIGKKGLKITYDAIFKKIFDPLVHPERLEEIISELIGRKVKIIDVLTKEGSQLAEKGSFVIMDALVQLDDGTYANVEMQKIGYDFPLERVDCYAADIIMRQYVKSKSLLGNNFNFKCLNKVYCIILMEKSPLAFKYIPDKYLHRRFAAFESNIYLENTGLHEDFFICLDVFQEIVHNITKSSTLLEAWMMFLSATQTDLVLNLTQSFPQFIPLYQEITDFIKNPEELMDMFSEELYIMDRNTERLMVEELQDEVNSLTADVNALRKELAEKEALIAQLQKEKN